jgi:hypothetical protein
MLSLLSKSIAERLRLMLGEKEDEAGARMAEFLGRTQAMRPTVE